MFEKLSSKYNLKFLIPSGICLILLLYFVVTFAASFFHKPEPDPTIYKICTYSGKETLQKVAEEKREEVVLLKDYNYYGESLNLYFETYSLTQSSFATMKGQTLAFVNMCTGEETLFEPGVELDSQVNLGSLAGGFYSVYIKSGETYKRIYFDYKLTEDTVFYTVTRNGKRAKVQLIGDSTLFNEANATADVLDHNYLYVRVDIEDVQEVTSVYDVAITTAPSLTVNASTVGAKANGITEAEELWKVAEMIKQELEAAGLKVRIIKDSYDEAIQYYGAGGVLERVYQSKAKYLLNLDMLGANSYSTPNIYCSSLAKGNAGSAIAAALKQTALNTLELVQSGRTDNGYDDTYEIREAGGLPLGAGAYSASSKANESFAANNRYGIDTVLIVYIDINKASDVNTFTANQEAIAKATAQGLLEYLNIKK
ncbi:MAG: N-acetylmuramoyl-L-alanine amidase [Erysipelotrichaceae bacterium]|nr:N-acetylmuramoyl-L-alanine amidase [Erysipelotrichaceae bacterium]